MFMKRVMDANTFLAIFTFLHDLTTKRKVRHDDGTLKFNFKKKNRHLRTKSKKSNLTLIAVFVWSDPRTAWMKKFLSKRENGKKMKSYIKNHGKTFLCRISRELIFYSYLEMMQNNCYGRETFWAFLSAFFFRNFHS